MGDSDDRNRGAVDADLGVGVLEGDPEKGEEGLGARILRVLEVVAALELAGVALAAADRSGGREGGEEGSEDDELGEHGWYGRLDGVDGRRECVELGS